MIATSLLMVHSLLFVAADASFPALPVSVCMAYWSTASCPHIVLMLLSCGCVCCSGARAFGHGHAELHLVVAADAAALCCGDAGGKVAGCTAIQQKVEWQCSFGAAEMFL